MFTKDLGNQFPFWIKRAIIVIWILTIKYYKERLKKMIHFAFISISICLMFGTCHSIPKTGAKKTSLTIDPNLI